MRIVCAGLLVALIASTTVASPLSHENDQRLTEQSKQQFLQQMQELQQRTHETRLEDWYQPAPRVLPIYYWRHIGTFEDEFVVTALCGGDVADCGEVEVQLRAVARDCLLPIVLVDLDLFDWTETFDFGDGEPPRPLTPLRTIFQVEDPSFVLLGRERVMSREGGQSYFVGLGNYQVIDLTEVTATSVTEATCLKETDQ